jgi:hypothetical protein
MCRFKAQAYAQPAQQLTTKPAVQLATKLSFVAQVDAHKYNACGQLHSLFIFLRV